MEDNPQVEILKKKLSERTGSTTKNSVDAKIIAKTQHWLASYPRALKSYKQAIEKFENVALSNTRSFARFLQPRAKKIWIEFLRKNIAKDVPELRVIP